MAAILYSGLFNPANTSETLIKSFSDLVNAQLSLNLVEMADGSTPTIIVARLKKKLEASSGTLYQFRPDITIQGAAGGAKILELEPFTCTGEQVDITLQQTQGTLIDIFWTIHDLNG